MIFGTSLFLDLLGPLSIFSYKVCLNTHLKLFLTFLSYKFKSDKFRKCQKYLVSTLRQPIWSNALLMVRIDAAISSSCFNFLRVQDGLSNKALFRYFLMYINTSPAFQNFNGMNVQKRWWSFENIQVL